jgi:hypothetical protein
VGITITRREWIIALIIAFIATALMQTPYVLGYVFAYPKTEFTGLLISLADTSYLAIIRQGFDGAWLYHIQFTPEAHDPAFLYGFYLGLGHLARFLDLSNVAMWHVARVISALLVFVTSFGFIALFLEDPFQRRVAYLLAVFGAGFDWMIFPFEQIESGNGAPVDFRMPEAHLFFSALAYPHFSIGIALLLISFWLMLLAMVRGKWVYAVAAGIANLLLGIVYPFLIFLVIAVLGAYWIYSSWRARKILWYVGQAIAVALLIPAPLFIYYESVLLTNPVFRTWNAQAVTPSPNPLHYLLTYGAMLALGWATLKNFERFALLWLWVGSAALLLYAPLSAQRRFVEGLQVPLAILATAGLFQFLLPRLERTRALRALIARPNYNVERMRFLLISVFLVLMSTANMLILQRLIVRAMIEQPDPLFRPILEMQAMDWLHDHTSHSDTVLASYPTASYIPARSGNAVFVGQMYETSQFEDKLALAGRFFDVNSSDAFRRDLLERYGIAYIFWGPRERALGAFDPTHAKYLGQVYSNEVVSIYCVEGSGE